MAYANSRNDAYIKPTLQKGSYSAVITVEQYYYAHNFALSADRSKLGREEKAPPSFQDVSK